MLDAVESTGDIWLTVHPHATNFRKYHFAGHDVVTSISGNTLKNLGWPGDNMGPPPKHVKVCAETAERIAAQGIEGPRFNTWMGERWRTVQARFLSKSTLLSIDGFGEFVITPDCALATSVGDINARSESEMLEIGLGPLLAVLLAERGVYSLHASAIADAKGVICFIGESGAGKSSLGSYLGTKLAGARRIADDILPVTMQTGLMALPDYPQLKLPADQQSCQLPAAKIRALLSVNPTAGDHDDVQLVRKSKAACALALAKQTVASRVFREPLLRQHLNFCADAGARVPYYELIYPHKPESLTKVCLLLSREFG